MPPHDHKPRANRASRLIREVAKRYPPILRLDQAAEILQVEISTMYGYSSEGKLKPCVNKVGRHLRLDRDCLVRLYLSGKLAS